MSASVGTMRGGSNRHSGTKEKTLKGEKGTSSKQKSSQSTLKSESQSSKMHPTQEQIILAQRLNTNHSDADPKTKKLVDELMELTGKSEDVVVIALHDAENDADRAVNMLLEGDNEQRGEWREQGGKRKKKATTNQKDGSNQGNEDSEGRGNKDRGDKEDKDQEGVVERFDAPPRRGRQNGGPPPRLARGRGRDRGNFGDRDRNNAEDWDIDKGEDRRERSGSDRGRPRGRGFGGKRGGGGRGRFNNSSDRDNRSFNRVPRFEKTNHSQPLEGPEIDTWTNETAETNTNKDTDWDNWNDTWVNEEDQWTGTLEETKVFTPSQMKIPEPDPVISEPPSSLGQRLDVGSLFIESAKYSKAPDYTKPSSDAYITQFNQAATESIKNTIGIGSASRAPASSLTIPQQSSSNTLGLSSLTQSSGHVQSSVLGNLAQGSQSSMSQTMTQLSQITQSSNQAIGLGSQQSSRDQAPPAQSRIQSVMQQQQQQNIPTSLSTSLQQRPKPPRSKLPPPSKIPSSAVEMPGHIPRNPQLDLQFGIDFTSDSGTSFSFGAGDDGEVPSSYPTSTSNGSQSVISNHLSQAHVAKSNDSNSMVLNMKTSPSAGSNKVLTSMEAQQSNRTTTVYHNSVYTSSPPKNENQSLERDQNKLEHKSSPMMSQRSGSTLSQSKESSSNYPTANGYAPSYQTHQKASSISQTQTYTHTTNSQPPQSTNFSGQYPASQSYPSNLSAPPSATQYPPGQPPQFNNAQNQYSSGQGQFASAGSSNHASIPHANHQSQYSGTQNSYSSGGQSQYSSYPNNSSFPTQPNYPSTNQSGGSNSTLYPVTTQSGGSSYNSQSNSYQSPSAGSYHTRDSQQNASVTTQSNTGVTYPTASQSVSLKPASSQTNTNYNSQNFAPAPVTLQTSSLTNKLEQNLSKITLKDTASLDGHPSAQYDHSNTSTTVSTSLSLPSSTSSASLSTGTTTISSTSTATSITSTSRIASMPSTSKAPPNLPPGVPLMGQYIMGQSTMPPYFTVPPLYGFEPDMLLQQRMPMQTGSYYDIGAFPAPAGSALPTGRDQQQPLTTVSFSGTSADSSKMTRVDAQSPNSTSQPQNAQQIPINFHYGYYYPSMFPGATSIQYPPVFPVTPVTNTAAHTGATANPQFQKTFASVYAPKGYDELNQAQDFSKTGYGSSSSTGKSSGTRSGTSDITPNAYNKTHSQAFDKQGFHGGTPPPFNLPLATATQAGPMAAPTTPYGAPFVPVMAAHQPHSQMMHHPIQQDSNSSTSRGLNQQGNQSKSGGAKGYGAPQYWNN